MALAWRLLYLARLAASPLGGSLSEDSVIYWRWSGYLLQHGLWGKNPFFMGPLYPYCLTLVRPLSGDSVQGVLFVQAMWGAASAALLADAARRLTGPMLGIGVGLLVATYEMAVFFDGLVLMESLLFFLESLLVWWVVRTDWTSTRAIRLLVMGALIGLIAEGRASSGVLLLPALLFVAFVRGPSLRMQVASGALVVAGFLIAVLPGALRNYQVSHEWIPFTYNGGFNLFLGNSAKATGGFTRLMGTHIVGAAVEGGEDGGAEADTRDYLRRAEHVDLGPRASSAYWSHEAYEFIATHPVKTVDLAFRKIRMMWNRREYPQIENVDQFNGVAGPVGLPFLGTFAFVGALSLGGLLAAWGLGPAGRFLAGYAVLMTLAVAPFFVTDRYRHHLVPAVVILAGLCLHQLAIAWRRNGPRAGAGILAATLSGFVIVNLPAPQLSHAKYEWGLAFDLGTRWAEHGRLDLAIPEYEKALRMETQGVVTLDASDRGDLYYNYANALSRLGRHDEAVEWYARAVHAAPDHALAIRALADARLTSGHPESADSLYRVLETKAGGHVLATIGRARIEAARGNLPQAEEMFASVVREDPSQYDAWGALVRVQVQSGELGQAAATLEAARRAGLPKAAFRAHDALLAALAHDRRRAEADVAEIPSQALAEDPALADVVRVVRNLLAAP